jgi:hypothetical protein
MVLVKLDFRPGIFVIARDVRKDNMGGQVREKPLHLSPNELGVALPFRPGTGFGEGLQKAAAIRVILKNRLSPVAAIQDVIHPVR